MLRSAGAVISKPFPRPITYKPVVELLADAIGEPSVHVKPIALFVYRMGAPTTVRLLSGCALPLLRFKLAAFVSPQCAQSSEPSVVNPTVPDGVVLEPASPPPLVAAVTVRVIALTRMAVPDDPVIVRA